MKGSNGIRKKLHKMCNINYMERTHDIAEVPHVFQPKFFPTNRRERMGKKFRKKIKSRHVIYGLFLDLLYIRFILGQIWLFLKFFFKK
jgi:hypothetical protein